MRLRIIAAVLMLVVISMTMVCAAPVDTKAKDTAVAVGKSVGDAAGKAVAKEAAKHNKVASLSDQAATILDELHKGIKKSIPEVAGAVGRAIFWKSAAVLARALMYFLLLLAATIIYAKRVKGWWLGIATWARETYNATKGNYYSSNDCRGLQYVLLIPAVVLFILWMVTVSESALFDAKYWMGVLDQKAYLANLVLEKLKLL